MSAKGYKPPTPGGDGRRAVRQDGIAPTVGEKDTTDQQSLPLGKTRASFRTEEFVRVIRQQGYRCVWRKALQCPCRSPESEQPAIDCAYCNASGLIYIDPHEIQAIMTTGVGERKDNLLAQVGQMLEAQMFATTEAQYRLGHRDSLELTDTVMTFQEYLKKGDRHGVRSILADGLDSARYRIARVITMMYMSSLGPTRLEENLDFELTKKGLIRWLPRGTQKISDGAILSVLYEFHPVFVVVSHPVTLRDTVVSKKVKVDTAASLPNKALVKLDYIVDHNSDIELPVTGALNAAGEG